MKNLVFKKFTFLGEYNQSDFIVNENEIQSRNKKHFSNDGESNLRLLDRYHKNLSQHFPMELFTLYEDAVKIAFAQTTGRSYYQKIYSYLKRMKGFGDNKKVYALIRELKDIYKNQPAMREELDKIFG